MKSKIGAHNVPTNTMHVDTHEQTTARPMSGSAVRANKTAPKFSASASHTKHLHNNEDTLPAPDKRTDTTGHLSGHSVIMPSSNQD